MGGQYVPTPITTGLTDLDRVEVVAGLAEGDKVLLLPSASLMEAQQQLQNFINRRFGSGIPGMGQRPGSQGAGQSAGAAGGSRPGGGSPPRP